MTSPSSTTSSSAARAAVPAQGPAGRPGSRSGDGSGSRGEPAGHPEALLRRGVAAIGLLGIALIHLLDLPGKFSETPYLGVAYLGLMATAVGLTEALLRRGGRIEWAATAVVAGATLIGYTLSRTTGLPAATDDIGNWLEPLGLASLFVEGAVLQVACVALLRPAGRAR